MVARSKKSRIGKQGGFTLMELLVVLAFFAMIYAAFGDKITSLFSSNGAQVETDLITQAINDTRINKGAMGYPSGDLITPITNQWGGQLKSTQTSVTSFKLTDTKVPADECAIIVSAFSKQKTVTKVTIGSASITALPVSKPTAEVECNKATAATGNTIGFDITG